MKSISLSDLVAEMLPDEKERERFFEEVNLSCMSEVLQLMYEDRNKDPHKSDSESYAHLFINTHEHDQ